MSYAEFLLRMRAAALRQLSAMSAVNFGQGRDDAEGQLYLDLLKEQARGG